MAIRKRGPDRRTKERRSITDKQPWWWKAEFNRVTLGRILIGLLMMLLSVLQIGIDYLRMNIDTLVQVTKSRDVDRK